MRIHIYIYRYIYNSVLCRKKDCDSAVFAERSLVLRKEACMHASFAEICFP